MVNIKWRIVYIFDWLTLYWTFSGSFMHKDVIQVHLLLWQEVWQAGRVNKLAAKIARYDELWLSPYVLYFFPFCAGILTPSDEFMHWAELSESAEKNNVRERATYFFEQFKPIQKVCLQAMNCHNCLNEKNKNANGICWFYLLTV